jgi:NAD(P)-dependent dehydrogenase (short-subunit alcohol dehydrogenase family)
VIGRHTTADEVLEGLDLSAMRAIVTGAAVGLGRETARALAARGVAVTVAGRGEARMQAVAAELSAVTGNPRIDALELDLASLVSVRDAASRYRDTHPEFNTLINNAGVMACPMERSAEGHEMQFAACHLGHFLFTCLLVPSLLDGAPARVVNLSSAGHKLSPVVFEDIDYTHRPYDKWQAYGQAKTANILFSVALHRRLGNMGVSVNAVHPGAIRETSLGRYLQPEDYRLLAQRSNSDRGFDFKSLGAGAATTAWAATAPQFASKGGLYLEDCSVGAPNEDPVAGEGGYRPWAVDAQAADLLWQVSEEMVGERFAWVPDA